jgi:enoyl-CoA hydratase/carnithine racemase
MIRLERHGQIGHLIIDRAAKRNAITLAMWQAFPGLIAAAEADPAIRVIILRAAVPGAFSAGADIAEFAAGVADPDWRQANNGALAATQIALARCAKPVIAHVEGDCVGGGCGLAMACDIRVASSNARFGVTPAKLGLVYSLHDTKLLVDLVGPGQAKRILFSAGLIDAAEAHRIGLVELLDADPLALAAQIAGNSAHSVRESKRMVRRILDGQADDDAETTALFAAAFQGADFAEGVAAFMARRKAVFP